MVEEANTSRVFCLAIWAWSLLTPESLLVKSTFLILILQLRFSANISGMNKCCNCSEGCVSVFRWFNMNYIQPTAVRIFCSMIFFDLSLVPDTERNSYSFAKIIKNWTALEWRISSRFWNRNEAAGAKSIKSNCRKMYKVRNRIDRHREYGLE